MSAWNWSDGESRALLCDKRSERQKGQDGSWRMRARELDRAEFQSDIEPRDRVDPHLYPRQAHRAKALFLRLEGNIKARMRF